MITGQPFPAGRISEPEFAPRPGSATVLFARRHGSAGRQPHGWHADVAQLVEHHLAKVRVAGSNPVVRSETPNTVGNQPTVLGFHGGPPAGDRRGRWPGNFRGGVAEWFRQGPAKPCTRVRFPSPPLAPDVQPSRPSRLPGVSPDVRPSRPSRSPWG